VVRGGGGKWQEEKEEEAENCEIALPSQGKKGEKGLSTVYLLKEGGRGREKRLAEGKGKFRRFFKKKKEKVQYMTRFT